MPWLSLFFFGCAASTATQPTATQPITVAPAQCAAPSPAGDATTTATTETSATEADTRSDLTPVAAPLASAPPSPVCVVLSVGAEQGLAHIGVLNALRERGVQVECVIGTSMGALIGGLYASAPNEDLAQRYTEVFALYAGKRARGMGDRASDLWFAATSALGTAKGWDRMRDVLGIYLGNARIESLPIPFVTVHQLLTETGARSETVRGGRLSDEIAASIANPLIFPGMNVQQGMRLDPGLDRVSSVPLETACEQFPHHQFVVSNVTPSRVFVSTHMACPYQELSLPGVAVDRQRAFTGEDPDFTRLVRSGYDQALSSLDFSRLPQRLVPPPTLAWVHVTLDIELTHQGPDGAPWDGVTGLAGLPDIRQSTRILACPGCEPRGTHAGRERTSEGTDSRTLHADFGVLGLRPGFMLRTRVTELDVTSNDDVGTLDVRYQPGTKVLVQKLPHATLTYRFEPN